MVFGRFLAAMLASAALVVAPASGATPGTIAVSYVDGDLIALSVDYDGGKAFAMGYADSPDEADAQAVGLCQRYGGTSCKLVFGAISACLGYADDGHGAWGAGERDDPEAAMNVAVDQCAKHAAPDKVCRIRMIACPG